MHEMMKNNNANNKRKINKRLKRSNTFWE